MMVPLKLRVDEQTKNRLQRVVDNLPHLSMNAYVNNIILEKLDQVAPIGGKK